jgi:hypothetical protein
MKGFLTTLAAMALTACGLGAADSGGDKTPGTSGTNTGLGCVESDLIAQCPPGSNPDLNASATSECEGQANILLSGDGGSIEAACRGTGECLVVCNFQVPCDCGVDAITTEGIFCTPCTEASACGDAVCEGGEDQNTCPVDCAASCAPNTRRCNGRNREDCNGQGQWETVTCREDQACEVGPGGVACVAYLSPAGGTWPGTGWEDITLPGDPAEVYFPEAEIGCSTSPGNCLPLAFLEDGRLLGTYGGTLAILSTQGAEPEALPVNTQGFSAGVDLPWVVAPARQPELFNLDTRQKRTAEAVVDDVTELQWGAAAVDAAHNVGAVSFVAAGQPFVALYDLETAKITGMLRYAQSDHVRAASSLAFSPDGQLLAELRPEGMCIVWNVAERKHTRLIVMEWDPRAFPIAAIQVAFTRGLGPYLILTNQARAEVWDLDVPERVRLSEARSRNGFSDVFNVSPDGRLVAAAAADIGGLGLYYVDSFEFIRSLVALPVNVGQVGAFRSLPYGIFSPDGRKIAAGNLVFSSYEAE